MSDCPKKFKVFIKQSEVLVKVKGVRLTTVTCDTQYIDVIMTIVSRTEKLAEDGLARTERAQVVSWLCIDRWLRIPLHGL